MFPPTLPVDGVTIIDASPRSAIQRVIVAVADLFAPIDCAVSAPVAEPAPVAEATPHRDLGRATAPRSHDRESNCTFVRRITVTRCANGDHRRSGRWSGR